MSTRRSFRSLVMAATCASAALGCYMVSLRVASERAALEDVESQIVMAQRDLRVLQTEIGTRGRLAQLERWNVKVLSLSAPSADQFLSGSFELAKLAKPEQGEDIGAPVVLASAPAPQSAPPIGDAADDAGAPIAHAAPAPAPVQNVQPRNLGAKALLSEASLRLPMKSETREVPVKAAPVPPARAAVKSTGTPVTAAKPVKPRPADKSGLAAAKTTVASPKIALAKSPQKKSVDKPTLALAKPVTKPAKMAKADPLSALPDTPRKTPR